MPGKTCTDAVHSNTKSARKFTCFQLFCIRRSGKLFSCLIQRDSQAPLALEDFLTYNGSPLMLQSDNVRVMTSKIMKKILRKERTQQALAELKYQNQNRVELIVQIAKDLYRLMSQHHCLPQHWYYALEMACDIVNHTSREGRLNEQVPVEVEDGHTPYLSRFRFSLWQEIQFEKYERSFPNERWNRGRHLGHAPNNGDPFAFKVLDETSGNIIPWLEVQFKEHPEKLREAKLLNSIKPRCQELKGRWTRCTQLLV